MDLSTLTILNILILGLLIGFSTGRTLNFIERRGELSPNVRNQEKLLKEVAELRSRLDLLDTERNEDDKEKSVEQKRALEAEKRFTEGIANILGYDYISAGKKDAQ